MYQLSFNSPQSGFQSDRGKYFPQKLETMPICQKKIENFALIEFQKAIKILPFDLCFGLKSPYASKVLIKSSLVPYEIFKLQFYLHFMILISESKRNFAPNFKY